MPTYKLGEKLKTENNTNNPGPGTYEAPENKSTL